MENTKGLSKKALINNAAVLEAMLRQIAEDKLTQYKPQTDKEKAKEIDYVATYAVIVGTVKSTLAIAKTED